MEDMGLPESRYVYLLHTYGLRRFPIPQIPRHFDDDEAAVRFDSEFKSQSEYELELVCDGMPRLYTMGMFSSHDDNKVYFVGGMKYTKPFEFNTSKIHIFDPLDSPEGAQFPLRYLPPSKSRGEYEPLVKPYVFRTTNHIYLLSVFDQIFQPQPVFSFQSFDPKERSFQTLQKPLLPASATTEFFATHFIVLDYIYLFTRQSKHSYFDYANPKWVECAFSFNTKTPPSQSQWQRLDKLSSQLVQQNIPVPYEHAGDTGLSLPFSGNIRILIALYNYKPTAYLVSLDETGDSLLPISHRPLIDTLPISHSHRPLIDTLPISHSHRPLIDENSILYIDDTQHSRLYDSSHLLDLGDERFCVICTPRFAPLLVYIFKMDFSLEYENWCSSEPPKQSVTILCSKKLKYDDIEGYGLFNLSNACLVSVPASLPSISSSVPASQSRGMMNLVAERERL